jgi:hypothetical protein
MSKLGCECGGIISDTTDNIPYKGSIIRDQDDEALYDSMAADIGAFINALLQGEREKWIRGYFLPGYPVEGIGDEEVVSDIFSRHLLPRRLDIYQCMECGSIKIQKAPESNEFSSFTAHEWDKGSRSILAKGKVAET